MVSDSRPAAPPTAVADQPKTLTAVSVIVVGYNNRRYLEPCLSRLLAQSSRPQEVIFVDNASTDGSAELAAQSFPGEVTVIASDRNDGYMAAVDLAMQRATTDYVAILNLDTEPDRDWLAPLAAFLDDRPLVGAVTPKVLLADQRNTINARGLDIHVAALGFNSGLATDDSPIASSPHPVDGIHGCSFLIRRDLLADVLPLVRDCFLYHEDVQISWLIHMLGYQIYCVPESRIYHHYSLEMFPEKLFLLERNRWEMLAYAFEIRSLFRNLPILVVTELLVIAYSFLKGPRYVWAKLRAYAAVWRRRGAIAERRRVAQALRTVADRQFFSSLKKGYAWRQLAATALTSFRRVRR